MIAHTVVNALAIVSGIVCDGAKASCAAKIATAVEAGIFGYNMYIRGQEFYGGDGIVAKGIETSLKNVGRLGKEGMKETNEEILPDLLDSYLQRQEVLSDWEISGDSRIWRRSMEEEFSCWCISYWH